MEMACRLVTDRFRLEHFISVCCSNLPDIQINIKRCLSDGCDTRIHGLKTLGYQITKSKEVSVSDASAIWYLSLLTSLVTASMETNPVLAQTVLQSTQ